MPTTVAEHVGLNTPVGKLALISRLHSLSEHYGVMSENQRYSARGREAFAIRSFELAVAAAEGAAEVLA